MNNAARLCFTADGRRRIVSGVAIGQYASLRTFVIANDEASDFTRRAGIHRDRESAGLRAHLSDIVNGFRHKRMDTVRQFRRIEAPFALGISLGFTQQGGAVRAAVNANRHVGFRCTCQKQGVVVGCRILLQWTGMRRDVIFDTAQGRWQRLTAGIDLNNVFR